MSSQDQDQGHRVVAVVLIAAIVLAVGVALGLGIHQARGRTGRVERPVPVPAPAAAAQAPVDDDASVLVEAGVVKFYFAPGKADLAPGALDALNEAIAAAGAGRRLVISGFHDTTGDPGRNAELARQRAAAVRDALKRAGVAETRLELKKPAAAAGGTGSRAEARRVEVMTAP